MSSNTAQLHSHILQTRSFPAFRSRSYDMLNRVSRSFAIVIQQLPEELRDSICIFYLVLRALDTVEDDMKIPVKEKVPILRSFWEKISDPKFRVS